MCVREKREGEREGGREGIVFMTNHVNSLELVFCFVCMPSGICNWILTASVLLLALLAYLTPLLYILTNADCTNLMPHGLYSGWPELHVVCAHVHTHNTDQVKRGKPT